MKNVDSRVFSKIKPCDVRLLELAARWDDLVCKARTVDWGDSGLIDLAADAGLEWYGTRGNEPLSRYLKHDGDRIVRLPGFGRKKLGRLCDILAKSIELRGESFPEGLPMKADLREILIEWDIPLDFPVRLCELPVRVLRYCDRVGIVSFDQLIDEWLRLGFEGFIDIRNLGTKSVRRLELLMHSIENRDIRSASMFLPLNHSGRGLSLSAALASLSRRPNPVERAMLHRRLIKRMTLEESAKEAGVTRERVRQIEANFLGDFRSRLDYFEETKNTLLQSWVDDTDWFASLRPIDEEALVRAAIEMIFEETPQACARSLGIEAMWDGWRDDLRQHPDLWFGGVVLERYIADCIPPGQIDSFCECVASSHDLRLDHVSGIIFPTKTGLYHSVLAMLAREDDPIPLTWLASLLVQSGYHSEISTKTIRSYRKKWLERNDFPGDKIIWDQ